MINGNKVQYNGGRRIRLGGSIIILVAALAVCFMFFKKQSSLDKQTKELVKEIDKGPVVKVIKAGMSSGGDKGAVFIGEARPYQSIVLYAKTSGYMDKIFVDKGMKVKEGQLLATIVSPETDQLYKAAIADLDNKKKILQRDQALVQKEYISKESFEASQTAVSMAAAQVQSLREQMAYKNITAPFSGTITARYADPGALVQNATNSQTSALPIVTLSQLNRIRIYIYVPQADADNMRDGDSVTITLTEKPDMQIHASITRIAGELDPKTRMMLVEIDLNNTDDAIIPGSYVQVHMQPEKTNSLVIPSEGIVVRGNKYFVPLISADSAVHYKPVNVGSNDGVKAAILSGVNQGDMIGLNVGADIHDGQKVRVQL